MTITQYIKDNLFIIILTAGLILWFLYLKFKAMKDSGYFAKRKELKEQKKLEKKKLKEAKAKEKFTKEAPEPIEEVQHSYFKPRSMMSSLLEQKKRAIQELKSIDKQGSEFFEYEKKLHTAYTNNTAEVMKRKSSLERKYNAWQNHLENIDKMIEDQKRLEEELEGELK